MKSLTLLQPWATLVAIGEKRIETRSWWTNYRGVLAIHASRSFPRDALEMCCTWPFNDALKSGGIGTPGDLPRGAIIAVARFAMCIPTEAAARDRDAQGVHELEFGDFTSGRWAWLFEWVCSVEPPVPCRGARGLWLVPSDVAALVRERLALQAATHQ